VEPERVRLPKAKGTILVTMTADVLDRRVKDSILGDEQPRVGTALPAQP
jgi:hypothetical protein